MAISYLRLNSSSSSTTSRPQPYNHRCPSLALHENKLFLALFGCAQNTLASGLIYGWAGISGTILIAPIEQGGAGLDPSTTIKIFSVASSFSCVCQFLNGMIQDRYGPRVCSVLSNVCVGLGCFIFVCKISASVLWTYYLGAMLMGAGGPGVQMSTAHLGNLFPGRENTAISCIINTISLSFIIFPWFSSIWSGGDGRIGFAVLFRILGATIWIFALVSIFLWPDEPYQMVTAAKNNTNASSSCIDTMGGDRIGRDTNDALNMDHNDEHDLSLQIETLSPPSPSLTIAAKSSSSLSTSRATSCIDDQSSSGPGDESQNYLQQYYEDKCGYDYMNMTLKQQIFSGKMIRLGLFFIVTSFWSNLYVASMTVELKEKGTFVNHNDSDDDGATMHELIQIFSYMLSSGIVVTPIVGHMLDTVGYSWTSITTCVLGILQILLIFAVDGLENSNASEGWSVSTMVLSFVLYWFFQVFLYPCFFGTVATVFGFRNFGVLSGLVAAISGIVFLALAIPLTNFAIGGDEYVHGRWNSLHKAQIACLTLLVLIELKYRDVGSNTRKILIPTADTKTNDTCRDHDNKKFEEVTPDYGSVRGTELI